MKRKNVFLLPLSVIGSVIGVLALFVVAFADDNEHHESDKRTPVSLIGVISVPGSPITSADIAWVDPGTERYYFADRSNSGVDIIDAENNLYVGRVGGMAGALTSGGGTATTNGPGPNGVLVTPKRELWAGDGNSTVQVADVDPKNNPGTYLSILQTISTVWNATTADTCDSGTLHYCGRADELGYDPLHHRILIANNAPLSTTAVCPTPTNPTAHCAIDPYATLIDATTHPYTVLTHVSFAGAGGLEQPLWDPQIGKWLITVPGKVVAGVVTAKPKIEKLNADGKLVTTYEIDCTDPRLSGVQVVTPPSVSITGIALGENQHILVSACGSPIIVRLQPTTGSSGTFDVIKVIKKIGGGDEVWHNPGDEDFYVTAPDNPAAPAVGLQSLGVIDEETSALAQPPLHEVSGKNPAAFPENNHIFTIVSYVAPTAANPHPTNDSVCTGFGFTGSGCIAVFAHDENAEDK